MAVATSRRTPQQQRSKAKVDAILDAADHIVAEHGVEALTTTVVAERAGFAVGTLYQYFQGIDGIADALVARHAENFAHDLLEKLRTSTFRRKRDAANVALDALLEFYRGTPSFRELWHDTHGVSSVTFGSAGDILVGMVIDALVEQGMAQRDDPDFVLEAEVQWGVAQALVPLAFKRDPEGDPAVIAHLRRLWDLNVGPHPDV